MQNRYRALVWEQNRVAAPAAGMCFLAGVVMLVSTRLSFPRAEVADPVHLMAAMGTALVLLLRNNHEGHLVTEFERRLARLPVKTLGLVLIPLFTRLLYLGAVSVASVAAHWLIMGSVPGVGFLVAPFAFYLAAQTFTWSRRSITGLEYVLPLLALLVWIFVDNLPHLPEAVEWLLFAAFLGVLLLSCGPLAVLGVHLERRDTRVGLPTLRELWEWLNTRDEAPREAFASPAAAQLWYERKRNFRMLPLLTILILPALCLPVYSLVSNPPTFLRWMPAAAMLLAAIPVGLVSLWPRSNYELMRPQDNRALVRAKLSIMLESILSTAALVPLLTILVLVLSGSYVLTLIREALAHGEMSIFDVGVLLLGPALVAAIGTWFLIVGRQIALASVVVVTGLCFIFLVAGLLFGDVDDDWFYLIPIALMIPCVERWIRAYRRSSISRQWLGVVAVSWLLCAGFFWLLGPHHLNHMTTFWVALLPAALLVTPLVSLSLEVEKRRTT